MTNTLKYTLALLLAFVLGAITGVWYQSTKPKDVVVETRVVERIDTIAIPVIEERVVYRNIIRNDTVYVAVADTTNTKVDSIDVVLPIERKVYADSLYRAVVSGYNPSLDSMTIYPRTRYIYTNTTTYEQPRWTLNIGAQLGVGLTPKGIQPYIGGGVSFGYTFGNKNKKYKKNGKVY